jgi:RNA-binding protein
MIGDSGLSEPVMKELERSLNSHELVKIKVAGGDRDARELMLQKICSQLDVAPVQHIGKVLVVYKPAEKPKLILPE